MTRPAVSAIISTRNRSQHLKDALLGLVRQEYPCDQYEIIVVDNGSTDDTREVVEDMNSQGAARISYLYEPVVGLSQARNTGAGAAKGDIIAYTDDDAIPDSKWLMSLAAIFQQEENVACVGGKIEPLWISARPPWFPDEAEYLLGKLDYGEEVKELDFPRLPHGGNIAIDRRVFNSLGGFRTELGLADSRLIPHEEIELCYRAQKSGYRILYTPKAVVHHKMRPEILTKEFLLSRSRGIGQGTILLEHHMRASSRMRLIRRAIMALGRGALCWLRAKRFQLRGVRRGCWAECQAQRHLGESYGAISMLLSRDKEEVS